SGRRGRLVGRVVAGLLVVIVAYLAFSFWQVWHAARQDQARPVQAIVVLGAAQYNGAPSPDLKARLDHTLMLWHARLAPVIVVTGGKLPADRFTEATAAANYLAEHGVAQQHILREVAGRNSWESLESAAAFLKARHIHRVLLVSDPFHDERILLMTAQLGLTSYVSPTRTSPLGTGAIDGHYVRETLEVAAGRIVGFRALVGVGDRI
ncbi:MAG: YdcF family protein, partial [Acidimicrobiales bacterium]